MTDVMLIYMKDAFNTIKGLSIVYMVFGSAAVAMFWFMTPYQETDDEAAARETRNKTILAIHVVLFSLALAALVLLPSQGAMRALIEATP